MTKIFTTALLVFAVIAALPATAQDMRKVGKKPPEAAAPAPTLERPAKSNRTVMTDMLVPTECLDYGRTICAQLQGNASRKLIYGSMCYVLKNKTPHTLFVPLRSDYEIEQFLLNASAQQITREPCPKS